MEKKKIQATKKHCRWRIKKQTDGDKKKSHFSIPEGKKMWGGERRLKRSHFWHRDSGVRLDACSAWQDLLAFMMNRSPVTTPIMPRITPQTTSDCPSTSVEKSTERKQTAWSLKRWCQSLLKLPEITFVHKFLSNIWHVHWFWMFYLVDHNLFHSTRWWRFMRKIEGSTITVRPEVAVNVWFSWKSVQQSKHLP